MLFIETAAFTKRLPAILNDAEYSEFQEHLAKHPKDGDVIPGTGGLRKIRWSASGRGKRGGARVIYYYVDDQSQIWLLLIYAKNEKQDLSNAEMKVLKHLVEHWNG